MIKVIGFDADDTLWVNEPNYRQTEMEFSKLLLPWIQERELSHELFSTEMSNLDLYGFGAKGFILSMLETAIRVSKGKIEPKELGNILHLGKELLDKEVELLDGVRSVLEQLQGKCKIILATKGDLLDQERKLTKSGLGFFFHHIEIMSDKTEANYLKLFSHLEIKPSEFLMVGNSIKSDILPVLNLGGFGIHVPYHTTWQHEITDHLPDNLNFTQITKLSELPDILCNYEISH